MRIIPGSDVTSYFDDVVINGPSDISSVGNITIDENLFSLAPTVTRDQV